MDDEAAAIRHDLARYRNLLAMNRDERVRAALYGMIAELDGRLRALKEGQRKPILPPEKNKSGSREESR